MPLHVIAGPGCDSVGKDEYLEDELEEGDVVISAGRIFKSLTGEIGIPSENNPVALRLALKLRAVAIRTAREKELNGWVLTSNGNRADLEKLRQMAGADEVRVLAYTEAEACAKIRAVVPAGERRAACELGVKARWFGRYVAAPGDRQIRPGGVEEDREVLMGECETVRRAVEVEIRAADGGERLVGVILQEGRAASVRPEVFTPGSLVWGTDGIAIRVEHRGAEVARAMPVRGPTGEIRISAIATPEIRAAFASGKRFLSAEFQALAETRTVGGVREIQRAFVSGGAMVRSPEYVQARAEVRERASRRRPWL